MFVVDLIIASVITIILTLVIAAAVPKQRVRALHDLSAAFIGLVVATWAVGILVVGLGPLATATHWIPFVAGALLLAIVSFALVKSRAFRRAANPLVEPTPGPARAVVGYYSAATMLLLCSAVVARFFLVRL